MKINASKLWELDWTLNANEVQKWKKNELKNASDAVKVNVEFVLSLWPEILTNLQLQSLLHFCSETLWTAFNPMFLIIN